MPRMRLSYQGKRMRLDRRVVMGRHRDNQIRINDPLASRQHAAVDVDAEGRAYVEDLDSANGTKLNGEPLVARRYLEHGDHIVIGTSEVTYDERPDSAALEPSPDVSEAKPEDTGTAPPPVAPDEKAAQDEEDPRFSSDPEILDGVSRLDDLIGHILAGNKINRLIIQDAFSALFAGTQINLERPVAIRVFHPEIIKANSDLAEKALAISRQAGKINSEYLGKVHRCGITGGMLWFSMEMVAGRHLEDILEDKGPLEPLMALLVLERIALGLKEAHAEGVYHGDIRPRSIMINETGLVKVTNFGLAPVQYELQPPERKFGLGNPLYSDPLLASGHPLDARADLYSLGCVFHYMLTGEPPFQAATPERVLIKHLEEPLPDLREHRHDLPPGLNALLHGMMAKNRDWRYRDVEELLAEIVTVREDLLEDDEAASPAPRPAPQGRPAIRRRRSAASERRVPAGEDTSSPQAGWSGGDSRGPAPDDPDDKVDAQRRGLNRLIGILVFLLAVGVAFFLLRHIDLAGYIYGTEYADEVKTDPEWQDHGLELDFNEPGDLDRLKTDLDGSCLQDGALVAPDIDETVIRCHYPLGGRNWTVTAELSVHTQRDRDPDLELTLVDDGEKRVILSLDGKRLSAELAGSRDAAHQTLSSGALADLRLRITCRDCRIAVHVGPTQLLPPQRLPPLAAGRVVIRGRDADWSLRRLAITGRSR